MNTNNKECIGIDVSKDTLDIHFKDKSFVIKNDLKSLTAFIKETIIVAQQTVFCVMESTGGYERLARTVFQSAGVVTHLAHPSKVHAFGKVIGHFTKTDKLDAILLCKYAEFIAPNHKGDDPIDPVHEEIIALRRLAKTLEESLHQAQCRIKQMPGVCTKYLKLQIKQYTKQILKIHAEIDYKIDNNSVLRKKKEIMLTMKGVGNKIASILICELPELGKASRRQIASLNGVVPKTYQSGKKRTSGHIVGGRFHARRALYMLALVASRHDPAAKSRYEALKARGKPKKVALVALMRHAVIALNAMIKNSESYICPGA